MLFDFLKVLIKSASTPMMSFEQFESKLDTIAKTPALYSIQTLLWSLHSALSQVARRAAIYGDHIMDGVFAFILGILAGAMAVTCDYFPASLLYIHEFVSAFFIIAAAILFR